MATVGARPAAMLSSGLVCPDISSMLAETGSSPAKRVIQQAAAKARRFRCRYPIARARTRQGWRKPSRNQPLPLSGITQRARRSGQPRSHSGSAARGSAAEHLAPPAFPRSYRSMDDPLPLARILDQRPPARSGRVEKGVQMRNGKRRLVRTPATSDERKRKRLAHTRPECKKEAER